MIMTYADYHKLKAHTCSQWYMPGATVHVTVGCVGPPASPCHPPPLHYPHTPPRCTSRCQGHHFELLSTMTMVPRMENVYSMFVNSAAEFHTFSVTINYILHITLLYVRFTGINK